MTNYYTDKTLVPYKRTSVDMDKVVEALQKIDIDNEVKRSAYVSFRIESANGTKGINENYNGFQADSGRWGKIHDDAIIGVVDILENKTGKRRLFLAFNDVSGCLGMLTERLQGRGLYVGGTTHKILTMPVHDSTDLARAYVKEWVKGSPSAEPNDQELKNFISMYNQASRLFT